MSTTNRKQPSVKTDSNVDPRQRVRTVPMEALSLGYSRTGTMSMSAAFKILGITPWHYMTMTENPPDLAMWKEVLESKYHPENPDRLKLDRETFDHLLGHVGACTDQPAAIVAKELVEAYPEAKVILVERDVDKWFKSFNDTVIAASNSPAIPFVRRIDRDYIDKMAEMLDLTAEHFFHVTAKRESWLMNNPAYFEQWRQSAKAVYLAHNEEVKRVTPPERLLLFKLDQGWEPLCKFLGKPVPDVPFPRVNDTEALNELAAQVIAKGMKRGLLDIAKKAVPIVVLLVSTVIWYLRRSA